MWTQIGVVSSGGSFSLALAMGNGNFDQTDGGPCAAGSRLDQITLNTFKAVYRGVVVTDTAFSQSDMNVMISSWGCPSLSYG